MIKSFKHKGLRLLFESDDGRKLPPDMLDKIRLILSVLNVAGAIADVNRPSFRLHPLTADLKGLWSTTVRANWRIVFKFEDGDAFDVDFTDYH